APPGSQSRKRKRRAEALGRSAVPRCLPSVRLEIQESVPGFAVARGFLGALFRQKLERIVDNSLLPPAESVARRSAPSGQRPAADQAMRFGADMPGWANRLGLRCSKLPGLLSAEVKSRQPLFDQLIANAYQAGQGIGRHVDLLKFDDGILGVCLGADATLRLRRISPGALPVAAGRECALMDDDLDGQFVDVEVRAGDVYALCGDARYRWTHEISAESLRGGNRRVSLTLRKLLQSSWRGPE
ncbi:unnamed protein product, partial [Polarella glacialis]